MVAVDIWYEGVSLWDQQEYIIAMTSWPIFHGPLTSDFGQIIKVKIFVQGRVSGPMDGRRLIFHMMMYETSRNKQEPWPRDLYFMIHWLRTLARSSRLGFLSMVESQDKLMLASWYFIWECISMRPAGIYNSHDLLTYISRSADFILWPVFHG